MAGSATPAKETAVSGGDTYDVTDKDGNFIAKAPKWKDGDFPLPKLELAELTQETGEVLMTRIKDLASQCPPVYIEGLVGAYGQLVYIARGR